MQSIAFLLVSSLLIAPSQQIQQAPNHVNSFYNTLKQKGDCTNKLASGFFSSDGGTNSFSYCGDHLADHNVVYLQGTGGQFPNMDIDCDGTQGGAGDDGRCGSSKDTQSQTSFKDTVKSFAKGINDLNAKVHPYVVFGNVGKKFKEFDPRTVGIEPLSVMAVVCGGKLVFGIWGDENGDDGANPVVGEASISLATACFGNSVNGNAGHDGTDVLYLAFPGKDAVPGSDGANWAAKSFDEFESSITELGMKLINRLPGGAGAVGGGGDTTPPVSATISSGGSGAEPTKTKTGGGGSGATPTKSRSSSSKQPKKTSGGGGAPQKSLTASSDGCIPTAGTKEEYAPVGGRLGRRIVVTGFLDGATTTRGGDDAGASFPTEAPKAGSGSGGGSGGGSSGATPCGGSSPVVIAPQSGNSTSGDGAAAASGTASIPIATGVSSGSCSWEGHCVGAPCKTWDDCSDDLICRRGACAPLRTTAKANFRSKKTKSSS